MIPVLFDTNVLVDFLCGVEAAGEEISLYADRAISVITWMEVMAGTTVRDAARTRAVLASYRNITLSPEVAERAVQIRQQKRLKLPDAIILATAQTSGRLLVTRNTRDFLAADPGIRIPYRL